MVRIANIVTDEKFIDNLIELNDNICHSAENYYVLVYIKNIPVLKLIKQSHRILFVEKTAFVSFLENNHIDAVFLHNLLSLPLDVTPQIPKSLLVFWMAWGIDIYNEFVLNIPLYHHDTQKFVCNFKNKLIKKIKEITFYSKKRRDLYRNAISRVDYFSGVLPQEYGLMSKLNFFHAKQFYYSYNSLDDLKDNESNFILSKGMDVMLGNSAAPTNNHLDMFELVNSFADKNDIKYYAVLSYGASQNYINKIVSAGRKLWGGRFIPLLQFMNRYDFFKLYDDCGFCLYLLERQQAIGNIEFALKHGKKVFISDNCLTYHYFKSIGCDIYSIQKDLSKESLKVPLSEESQKKNYNIITSLYTINTETEKINQLVNIIIKNKK